MGSIYANYHLLMSEDYESIWKYFKFHPKSKNDFLTGIASSYE